MGSLFGGQQSGQNLSLFSNTAKSSPFGATNTGTPQQNTGTGTGGSLFGSSTQQKPLFGQTQQQPQQQQQQQQQQQTGTGASLFGGPLGSGQGPQKPAGGLFGGTLGGQQQQQPQQQQPQQQGSLFGGLGQTQQQQPQQQQSIFGGQPQGQQQQPQLGQSTQQPQGSSLWSPGRAVTGVHRTVPMQMAILQDKWFSYNRNSQFRTYLYNSVGEENAPWYQPGPEDNETEWEEALRKRPGSDYVPVLVHGFWQLGKRAQRQIDFFTMLQTRLHELNNCLTNLLSRHDLQISVKIADCRRKHLVLSKRCLALAAKTQVLRNRGYAMDDAEEELKKKLAQLERSVFDPSLSGRSEEIWARMLAIREHSTRLKAELEKAGSKAAGQTEEELDDNSMKMARKVLDDYHAQIQYLQKEMEAVKKDFEEATKAFN